jgi:8-oxo-dGTP pyrophosphatase MutT (NUDIX family)
MIVPPPTMRPWSRPRVEVVADYGIFSVEKGLLHDPAGAPKRDVFTFGCRDWCNVVAVTRDQQIVLVWQYRFGPGELSLEVPGGVIDPGEAPEAAARRELLEESGYEASSIELLASLQPNPALQGNRIFSYVAWDAEPTGNTAFDELEDCETALVPRHALGALLDSGQVQHALVTVALETFLRRHGTGPR